MTTSRTLLLLSLLQARREWSGHALAERLAVSERTVRRDVDRLRQLGYHIHATRGPDGGYRLEAGSELPPLMFDEEQIVALALALRTVSLADTKLDAAAERALSTVRQLMPARLRRRMDSVEVVRAPAGAPTNGRLDAATFLAVGAAIRELETLRFDYGAGATRVVEPHGLVAHAGRWYLLAWSPAAADWRTYRVDRMTLRDRPGTHFHRRAVPGGDVASFVAGMFKGSRSGDRWPCRGSAVLLAEAEAVAPFVEDGSVEAIGAGRCRVTLGSWSWVGLAAGLLRFDAELEMASPVELRRAFARVAGRAVGARGSSALL
ncbi:WYL domain-containing protein [Nannocystis sp. ILAH1]|uniref:helix-turn-helix transcriptional regulator n=1 Tax=Nannocystis sp. ILAH1 TaxID=2996789 RepID=UPI002271ADA0|nr:WYL domain-containing protein [Nannocystis sp. ILAH1]MCY0989485.1 WYL domain-containing protein [Nannocystis sp. ILAH1]